MVKSFELSHINFLRVFSQVLSTFRDDDFNWEAVLDSNGGPFCRKKKGTNNRGEAKKDLQKIKLKTKSETQRGQNIDSRILGEIYLRQGHTKRSLGNGCKIQRKATPSEDQLRSRSAIFLT